MILSTLLFGAAVIAGTTLIATFWNNIIDWLKRATQKVKEVIQATVYGCKVFIRKFQEGAKEISKHYSKKNDKWQETVVTREISESEVPDEIRRKAVVNQDVDITNELELQLA